METVTDREQGAPLSFANAPRERRDGGVFIERSAALRLIEKLRERDRELLDQLRDL